MRRLEVPLDRMLIETDSPFLAPVPYRGKRNEPAYREGSGAADRANCAVLSAEEVGQRTTQNFYRFFSLHEKRYDRLAWYVRPRWGRANLIR